MLYRYFNHSSIIIKKNYCLRYVFTLKIDYVEVKVTFIVDDTQKNHY